VRTGHGLAGVAADIVMLGNKLFHSRFAKGKIYLAYPYIMEGRCRIPFVLSVRYHGT